MQNHSATMLSIYGDDMDKVKPVVYFLGQPRWDTEMFPGHEVAHVFTLDHYVWGREAVRTSKVVKKNDDGSFETLNTRYVPYKDE